MVLCFIDTYAVVNNIGVTMKEIKDVVLVWTLNIISLFGLNYDVIAQRISVTLAILYSLMKIYGWVSKKLREMKEKKHNDVQADMG